MAENYNLGSSFGFNITPKTNTPQQKDVHVENALENLFDSMTSYVSKYENVFNGDVANEINMYSRQAMFVGMNLKASDSNIRKFDVNI